MVPALVAARRKLVLVLVVEQALVMANNLWPAVAAVVGARHKIVPVVGQVPEMGLANSPWLVAAHRMIVLAVGRAVVVVAMAFL